MATARSWSPRVWLILVTAWSLVFAAPHFYWALGGRAGLGLEVDAADAALQQGWFAAYNLAAGGLAVLGAALPLVQVRGWVGQPMKRWLLVLAAAAGVVHAVRLQKRDSTRGVPLIALMGWGPCWHQHFVSRLLAARPMAGRRVSVLGRGIEVDAAPAVAAHHSRDRRRPGRNLQRLRAENSGDVGVVRQLESHCRLLDQDLVDELRSS